jgi:hypothetical protein
MPIKDKAKHNAYMKQYRAKPKCFKCERKSEGIYKGFSEFLALSKELIGKPLCTHHMNWVMIVEVCAAGREEMRSLNKLGAVLETLGELKGHKYLDLFREVKTE